MLTSENTAIQIADAAELSSKDTVLEIGTGKGILTSKLASRALLVVSYEVDRELYGQAHDSLSAHKNVELILGDAFDEVSDSAHFDVCVTSLPYSESLRFMKWLSLRSRSFKKTVAVVQKEFANKLCSASGLETYRAVSVLAQLSFDIERLFSIDRREFDPKPRVISEAIRLVPKQDREQAFFNNERITTLNQLFSFRGRLLSAALKKLVRGASKHSFSNGLHGTRIESLTPDQFADLISAME